MFLNLVDDKAGSHDGVAGKDAERNQNADQTSHPAQKDLTFTSLKT